MSRVSVVTLRPDVSRNSMVSVHCRTGFRGGSSVVRYEEDVLPGRVAGTGQRPHGGGEDAARDRMMGDAVIADEIGQHRGPVIVLEDGLSSS